MSRYIVVSLSVFLAVAIGVSNGEKNCKQAVSELLKYQMSSITKCTKTLGYKGKEKTEKMNCIMKCVLIASGGMNPDGTLEIENGLKFILENIPLDVIDKALIGSAKCQRYAEKGVIDPNEANCKTYEPFIKCLTNFVMTLCGK
ncbi:hypothetical protein Ocin01_03574 [Orchesella cincta]|uniref:Uncharacterized protein n=1 Tax=Orchesella cincta TaxID=48709 RepID=A0A1D2NDP7_ORCCI|nr:hypothetical protein Ocin01_03574 [Orchesella cincta]